MPLRIGDASLDPTSDLLPDETGLASELAYRRSRRAVAASRMRPATARRALAWITGITLLVAPAYAALTTAQFALSSPLFTVRPAADITLTGNTAVPAEDVVSAVLTSRPSSASADLNAFRVPLARVRAQIEAISWVRTATVQRFYPHRLVVTITERQPVAYANVGGRIELVDREGAVLERHDGASFDFPVLEGFDPTGPADDRRARVGLYSQFMSEWSRQGAPSGWLISEVDVADAEDLRTILAEGRDTILVHFGHEDFAKRIRTFLASLPELLRTVPRIDSVDMRYRGQIVVDPQPAAASESRGGAETTAGSHH